ncbi:EamA family transporter [Bacillus sp. AFS073361]|uniref:DMT family transporter n=1 Tax=Bacillaceae TaxID=186817 RepID=UPI000BF2688F|nr:EamA family transporter [Bacillus sp. AFS073361]PFP24862.1 EamA family transporter [Bacillus sp. AFS073361]
MNSKPLLGSLCLFTAACLWGGMYVVGKFVLNYIPAFTLLWTRYALAFIILLVVFLFTKKEKIRRSDWGLLVFLGFIGYFLANGLAFVGTHLSTAHMASLIASIAPLFTVVIAAWVLKESLSKKKVVSIIITFCGVSLVIGMDPDGVLHMSGNLILLLGTLNWGIYCVYVKRAMLKYSALLVTISGLGSALIMTTPLMLWESNRHTFELFQNKSIWMGTLYIGVVATACAFYLWNKGIELIEAGTGAMFQFFTPVVGILLGWIYLGESLDVKFFIGGTLIIFGTVIPFVKNKNMDAFVNIPSENQKT